MNTDEPVAERGEESKERKGWAALGAVALLVTGVLAICLPLATSMGLVIILSWSLIIAGIGHLVAALRFERTGSFIWELVLAALCIYVGLYMRIHPAMGFSTLVFVLAAFFAISACSEAALYIRNRSRTNSGWILAHAVLNVILLILICLRWPANTAWLIGMFVGIDLLVAGISRIVSDIPFHHARPVSA
jgi:uncharacterized membrane protein HdeD (DUF308 family)